MEKRGFRFVGSALCHAANLLDRPFAAAARDTSRTEPRCVAVYRLGEGQIWIDGRCLPPVDRRSGFTRIASIAGAGGGASTWLAVQERQLPLARQLLDRPFRS